MVGAGILFAVLVDYRDTSLSNTRCSISDMSLYDVGYGRAYVVLSLHNLGSEIMNFANISFIDDSGTEREFNSGYIEVHPGHTWNMMDSFLGFISVGKSYTVHATITMDDDSMSNCFVIHKINP